jgi:hypothetical protein
VDTGVFAMTDTRCAFALGLVIAAASARAAQAQLDLGASGRVVTLPAIGMPTNSAPAGGPTVSSQEVTAFSAPLASDPYYDPKGIPLDGNFRLYPSLLSGFSYDDNVFRTPSAQQADYFFTINPTAVLDYQTSSARADLYADANFFEYARLSTVDTTNYDAGVIGGYEISRAVQVSGNASYSELSEPLSSPNVVGFQSKPSQYNLVDIDSKGVYKPNRIGVTLGVSLDGYNFLNTPLFGGGLLGNKDRNNDDYRAFVEGSYDFSPGYSAFLRGTYNDDPYQRYTDRTGAHRSSDGYQLDTGVKALLTNLLSGEAYVGYVKQNYDQHLIVPVINRPLGDISGIDFGVNLTWLPTNLLTVHLGAIRQFDNTTLLGASAGDDRNVNLEADYAMTRRIQLLAMAAYDDTTFMGTQTATTPNRDDKTFVLGVGGKWLISHYAYANLNYTHSDRSSSISAVAYHDDLITVGLNFQI